MIEAVEELAADKGYHSSDAVRDLSDASIHSYVSERKRGYRR